MEPQLHGQTLRRLERRMDAWFGERNNPLRQLGAIGFLLFWIVAATGVYLYLFFETSIVGAYSSVESITHAQWFAGGIMRSVHRYASDALVIVIALHLLRELAYGRYRGFRWFSWSTGVPLIVLIFVAGIGGYALVWDTQAQLALTATAEWLGALPGFGDAIVRNFVAEQQLSDRFFSLVVFLHIAAPLLLLAGMWIHLQRITRPVTRPSRAVSTALVGLLLILAAFKPALSLAPASLARVPTAIEIDWLYLFPIPLMYLASAEALWIGLLVTLGLLAALPWLVRRPRPAVARVDPINCNGCRRCFADCPFEAIVMAPHTLRGGREQAVVRPDLCASCGICAGACPSSTPFRSIVDLVTGIDMPQHRIGALRAQLEGALARLTGSARVVVFGCERSASAEEEAGVTTLPLVCAGQLPPSFIEFALRHGADGVLVAACPEGDCEYRLGTRWTVARIAAQREPHLRSSVPRARVRVITATATERRPIARALDSFRAELRQRDPTHQAANA